MEKEVTAGFGLESSGAALASGKRKEDRSPGRPSRLWKATLMIFLAALAASGSGCMSSRFSTNITFQEGAKESLKGLRFRIQSADLVKPAYEMDCAMFPPTPEALETINNPQFRQLLEAQVWNDERWTKEISLVLENRYPELFSPGPTALPLRVSIQVGHNKNSMRGTSTVLMVGTLTVLGTVLPLPFWEDGRMEIHSSLKLGEDERPVALANVSLERRDVTWMTLLTPFALLPVPGPAEDRHAETIFALSSPGYEKDNPAVHSVRLTVQACADAVVLSLISSEPTLRKVIAERKAKMEY